MSPSLAPGAVVVATLYLVVVVGAAVAVGRAVARRVGGTDPVERALVWSVASVAAVTAVGLAVGALGMLAPVPVLVVSAAVGGAALRWPGPRRPSRGATGIPAPAFGPLAALGVVSAVLGFTPTATGHHESQHYLFAGIAHLVDTGSLWTTPFHNPGFFTATHPGGTDLIGAVVSFATGGDHLLYGWLLPTCCLVIACAAEVLAAEMGARPGRGLVAGTVALAAPLSIGIGAHSLANDLVPVAGCLAGLALVLRSRSTDRAALVAVAGVALGLGVGAKYTAFVPTAAVVVMAALVLRPVGRAALVVPGGLALGAPWLVRNLLSTANPLYPLTVRVGGAEVFAGGSGPLDDLSGTVGGLVARGDGAALGTWADLAWRLYGPLAVATAAGIATACWLGVRHRRPAALVLAGFTAIGALGYATTPYTAAGDPPVEFLMGSNLRYALVPVFAGVVALLASLPARVGLATSVGLGGWALVEALRDPLRPDVEVGPVLFAVAVAGGGAVVAVARRRIDIPHRWRLLVSGAVVVTGSAAAVVATRVPPSPRPLEAMIADDEVVTVAVQDLRSIIGGDFSRRPVAPDGDDVEAGTAGPDALRAAIDAADADLLVVGVGQPGVPAGFVPSPQWREVAELGRAVLYRR